MRESHPWHRLRCNDDQRRHPRPSRNESLGIRANDDARWIARGSGESVTAKVLGGDQSTACTFWKARLYGTIAEMLNLSRSGILPTGWCYGASLGVRHRAGP